MTFEESLRSHPVARALGDTRFRYEPSLFIGEKVRPLRSDGRGTALLSGAAASGVVAFTVLLIWPSGFFLPLAFGAIAATLGALSARREQLGRIGRTFVLNFATETLRVDDAEGRWPKPRTRLAAFDRVKGVRAELDASKRSSLVVQTEEWEAELIAEVPPAQREDLAILWRFLEAAFGLRAPVASEAGLPTTDRFEGQ